ncbi:nucleotide exchange factor GrpE [Candidatus Wolfebacteria bacterium CG03_land_8_20_14_0_80_40_12]|uniref:Protein GrpE n=1 Tax=Candidatus Wolfebacteria bacterium CG03_land_8_20_14_0_80_40_12 TaxID=1975069 RepID=A0A2M7B555_9BACT|nr:MAG: nucleotide exchange factor GrpE [Candidatus Wolfebacteria bacterium CG03_land_8_20_14_0_80_40_12]
MAEEIQKNNEEKLKDKEEPAASEGGEPRPENNSGREEIDELSKCQKEREEYLDGWKRAKADLLNYKKDEAKKFEAVVKFANESLIKELINVLDSFDLALISLGNEGGAKTQKGLYLIRQQLEDALKQQGLERIAVSVGQQFNPALQEAIALVETEGPSDAIIEEVERGYLLNGRLIRPARVKISKN